MVENKSWIEEFLQMNFTDDTGEEYETVQSFFNSIIRGAILPPEGDFYHKFYAEQRKMLAPLLIDLGVVEGEIEVSESSRFSHNYSRSDFKTCMDLISEFFIEKIQKP